MQKLFFILLSAFFIPVNMLDGQTTDNKIDTLHIHLTGKAYKILNLKLRGLETPSYTFKGKNLGNNTWIFTYPDSIYNTHYIATLYTVGPAGNLRLSICTNVQKDTFTMAEFGIPRNGNLTLEFDRPVKFDLQSGAGMESTEVFQYPHPEFEVYFPVYIAILLKKPYPEFLAALQKFIKDHPDSHYLPCCIYGWRSMFKTKQNIIILYNMLSDAQKNSFFGKKVKEYTENMP